MGRDVLQFKIETEQEEDGRWIAEVIDLPGVLVYGATKDDAVSKAQALALRAIADRIEHGETHPALLNISFAAIPTCANGDPPKHGACSPHAYVSVGASSGRVVRTRFYHEPDGKM